MKKELKKRASNGEGGLRQLESGKWEGTYILYRENGTKIKKSFTRTTRNEILDIKAKLRLLGILENNVQDINIDIHTDKITKILKGQSKSSIGLSKDITVSEYVDYYLETHRRNGLAGKKIEDTTFSSYVDRGKLIKRYIGNKKMKELTFEDLEDFINKLHKDTCDTTARQTRDITTNMMYFAKKDGVIEENVLQEEKLTLKERKGKTEKKIIQEEDIGTFCNCCMKYKYYDLLFILNTGTRDTEMAGVTWDNIDWENKTVKIEKAYTRVKEKEHKNNEIVTAGHRKEFKDLKTKHSYRTIGLNDMMIKILKQHKEEQKELARKNNKEFKEKDWVFTTKAYTGMLHDYICDKFRKIMNETKITGYEELTPHCLRHTYCTMGIKNGTRVEEMRDILGHGNISVTANWYTHLDKQTIINASNKVNVAFEEHMK